MYIPIGLIVFAAIGLICWLYSSGSIVVRRKPKIKLNAECRKYYDECEKLMFPFYENYRELYTGVLSGVEKYLDLFDQVFQKGNSEMRDSVSPLYDSTCPSKYYAWAVEMVCFGLMERSSIVYASDNRYKELRDNIYSKRDEIKNIPGIEKLPVCWIEKN